ncbi:NADH-ubiquinone oxidoreductase-F iron-sulfur binding region domain-containing protein [Arthrobacter sp. LAPM80]|uniref:NADH-ubiquinone oxidoreductase-F iron-sulfur binding region domain-containing protein n=1 Tax=Arthrobacter sp. LAPM80 TaxID=3141788 RepID=UPI00398B02A3
MNADTAMVPTADSAPQLGVARLFAAGPEARHRDHLAAYGPLPDPGNASAFLSALEASGLTGRGGAGFSSWRKFAAVEQARRTRRYTPRAGGPVLVANGAEGEPLSFKDATLLHSSPHLVIDGLLAAARVLGASKMVIYTAAANLEPVAAALAERPQARDIEPVASPEAFISGQASAVVNFLETGRALPTDPAGRLAARGFKGRPTLIHNAETWAHIALIARYGGSWFRRLGTPGDPGTRLLSITGDVPAELVLEVPGGALLEGVLASAGVRPDAVCAVLVGGYHGRWVRPAGTVLDVAGGAAASSVRPGAGVVHVMGHGRCGLAETARIVGYLAGQSARQCGPCLFGLPALAEVMLRLAAGRGGPELVREVNRLSALVAGRGACHHPDGTVQLIHSALETFADDVPWHLAGQCQASGGAL